MVKLHQLHKLAGLSAGLVLLILGVSGFFLNHDKWNFLYSTTFTNVPNTTKEADAKLFEAYWVDSNNQDYRILGSKRGIFETKDGAKTFTKMIDIQCLAIKKDESGVYGATSDGIYKLINSLWQPFSMQGEYITAISLSKNKIIAIVDKHELVEIQKDSAKILNRFIVEIDSKQLQHSIKLSRFVRDLHYGRGLFDGDLSLLINDYGAIVISLLAISGYLIWWLIRKKTKPKLARGLINWHANIFAIIAIFPLIVLAITGIFLDHSNALKKFMNSVTISHVILPPVYSSLKHDIWSVDYNENIYRIGNRYGVYKSNNLKNWELESSGLAYRMIRDNNILYVSGMGSPNRIYDGSWSLLKNSPHMFKDIVKLDGSKHYFTTSNSEIDKLPKFESATLYSLMLTLHDGSFFSSWWIWINDYASVALIVLIVTGTMRWYKKLTLR